MLSNPTAGRRLTGRVIVLAGIAVALPLTASRAIQYVDVPMVSEPQPAAAPAAVAPVKAVHAVAAVQAVQAPAPLAPVPAVRHEREISFDDGININGQRKRWQDLTPQEKAEIRKGIAEAKQELARINSGELQREMREAMEASKIDQEELRRELANARGEVEQAVRSIDASSAELRRHGQDPEALKAKVRASLASLDADAIARKVAEANPQRIAEAMAKAQEGLRKAEADIARLEALDRGD